MPAATHTELPVEVVRETPPSKLHRFTDYFQGFEKVGAVRSVFGEKTNEVLRNQKVSFLSLKFAYMGINDDDGSIGIGTYHLKNSDFQTLYLDIVHELFHIKQWQKDKVYFENEHRKFLGDFSLYYSSPIEVPAYQHTVREAERLGMTRDEIVEHLKMGPVPPKAFARFLDVMDIRSEPKSKRVRPKVRINRNAPLALFPFTDYFVGFEKAPAVRRLLGKQTARTLRQLRVEFVRSSFVRVIPSDEDGHLIVSIPYLKENDSTSVYLDILISLSLLQHGSSRKGARVDFEDEQGLLAAFNLMLEEARRLKVSETRTLEHMGLLQFVLGDAGYRKFLRKLGVGPPMKS